MHDDSRQVVMDREILRRLYTAAFGNGGRGQRCPRTGVPLYDCWGLVMAGHAALGLSVPDFAHDAEDAETVSHEFAVQEASGRWVRLNFPQAPCVVGLRTCPGAPHAVNHFGVYVGDGKFLHIMRGARVHLSGVRDMPYARQIAGYWRWTG